tara:strand:+ start:1597 stop:1902 length:306 start_codon:yes stop_codon:yes gene_type:complete
VRHSIVIFVLVVAGVVLCGFAMKSCLDSMIEINHKRKAALEKTHEKLDSYCDEVCHKDSGFRGAVRRSANGAYNYTVQKVECFCWTDATTKTLEVVHPDLK